MTAFRVIVVGLGVQGEKRRKGAGTDFVASVDPVNPRADFKSAADIPLDSYDAVLACVPDEPKVDLLRYFLAHGKHVLVEKPLWASNEADIASLEQISHEHGVI